MPRRWFVLGVVAAGLLLALVLPLSLGSGATASTETPPPNSRRGEIGPTQGLPVGQDGPRVPSMLGLQLSDAAKKLQSATLCLAIRLDPTGRKFAVVQQSPLPGSFAHLRQRVMLMVGLGIPPSQVGPGNGYNLFYEGLAVTPGCPKIFGHG